MNNEQAVEKLKRQISQIDEIKNKKRFGPEFKKWQRDTQVLIENIFGGNTRHIEDFNSISYIASILTSNTPESSYQKWYMEGFDDARSILESFIQEIEEYGLEDTQSTSEPSALDNLELICNRFHSVARQMRSRHDDRETLGIEDEYDVQDLFHALLCLFFDDIRPEEWTPSYAGRCSRMDFLLKQEEIVVEIKKTRKGLGAKEVGEQLIIDIEKYQAHPSCKTLVCFVYDPEGLIGNPRGIENDLNCEIDGFIGKVYIRP